MCRRILDISLRCWISKLADLATSRLLSCQSVILFSVSAASILLSSCTPPSVPSGSAGSAGSVEAPGSNSPQDAMGLYRQGKEMLKNRDPRGELAVRQALAAAEKEGNPHAINGIAGDLAQWLFDKERYREAKKLYASIAEAGAKSGNAEWEAEGLFKSVRCDIKDDSVSEEDLQKLERGLKLQPDGKEAANAKRSLAHVYSSLGKFDKAEAVIKENIGTKSPPFSTDLLEQSYLELCRGNYSKSFGYLQQAHQLPTSDGKPHRYWKMYNSWLQFHDPLSREWRKRMATVKDLFNAKNYAKLDAMAVEFRKDNWVNPKGYRKIYGYYEGIDSACQEDSKDGYTNHCEELKKWTKANPKSTAALIALAEAQKSLAWKARGAAYAKYVTEEGWKGLATHLAEADSTLALAKKTGAIDEHWYGTKLTVLLGKSASEEEYDSAYNEGTKAFPTAEEIQYDKAYRLQPRWHGAPGEFEEWLDKEANRIGGDDGDRFYARILYQLDDNDLYKNLFEEFSTLSWKRAKHGLELLCKDYPQALAIRGKMLKFAENAGDTSVTSQQVFGK